MTRFVHYVLAAGLTLAGCGSAENGPNGNTSLIQTQTTPIDPPDIDKTSSLRLVDGGRSLKAGGELADADMMYPKPEQRAAAFRDLPPGFGPEYHSEGWETDAEGFGVISLRDRIVVAVHTEYGVDEARVGAVLRKYLLALDSRFAPMLDVDKPDPQKSWARYWFVEEGTHRLMICAVRLKSGILNVTEALGYKEAMDALRMSKAKAKNDLDRATTKSTPSG